MRLRHKKRNENGYESLVETSLQECIKHELIPTLKVLIIQNVINVEHLFTHPVLDDIHAWFLTVIFFKETSSSRYIDGSKLWQSLLPLMVDVLKKKKLKPLPQRTQEILQLIACNDFSRIVTWLDQFSTFYTEEEFRNIVNNVIFELPEFCKLEDAKLGYFSRPFDFIGHNISESDKNIGHNLLSCFIFTKSQDDEFLFSPEQIKHFIKKYHLDTNAPNKTFPPTQTHLSGICTGYHEGEDMTLTYKTTLGRTFNVLCHLYKYIDKQPIERLKKILKILLETCNIDEVTQICNWYLSTPPPNTYSSYYKDRIKQIREAFKKMQIDPDGILTFIGMKTCSHTLFRNHHLLSIIEDYCKLDTTQSSEQPAASHR